MHGTRNPSCSAGSPRQWSMGGVRREDLIRVTGIPQNCGVREGPVEDKEAKTKEGPTINTYSLAGKED